MIRRFAPHIFPYTSRCVVPVTCTRKLSLVPLPHRMRVGVTASISTALSKCRGRNCQAMDTLYACTLGKSVPCHHAIYVNVLIALMLSFKCFTRSVLGQIPKLGRLPAAPGVGWRADCYHHCQGQLEISLGTRLLPGNFFSPRMLYVTQPLFRFLGATTHVRDLNPKTLP